MRTTITIIMLMLICSCGEKAKAQQGPGLFTQELLNYGFVRYENEEVVCYKLHEAISCVKRE